MSTPIRLCVRCSEPLSGNEHLLCMDCRIEMQQDDHEPETEQEEQEDGELER